MPQSTTVSEVVVTGRRMTSTQSHWDDPLLNVLRSIWSGIQGVPEDDAYTAPPVPDCCFAAGTLVRTDHGLRAIETVKLGDMVLSRDEKTGRTAFKPVIGKEPPTTEELYAVEVDVPAGRRKDHRAVFRASAPHPWRTTDGRWVATTELRHGMRLVRADGKAAVVEWVRDTRHKAITYNLEIADYHTYFVGRDGIWVHNACRFYRGRLRQKVFDEKGTDCVYCGKPATQVDHVNPFSRGGETTFENGDPACAPCNVSKGAQTPDEWLGPGPE